MLFQEKHLWVDGEGCRGGTLSPMKMRGRTDVTRKDSDRNREVAGGLTPSHLC